MSFIKVQARDILFQLEQDWSPQCKWMARMANMVDKQNAKSAIDKLQKGVIYRQSLVKTPLKNFK